MAENLTESLSTGYSLNEKGLLLYKDRLYIPNVPNVPNIRLMILNEIHKTPYSGHPGSEDYENVTEGLFLSKHEE